MKRSVRRDYYAVLGITATAAPRDIRRAYQRLARQYSPDVNFWDAEARSLFDEIAEAYRVLSDPTARAMYDRHAPEIGTSALQPGRHGDDVHVVTVTARLERAGADLRGVPVVHRARRGIAEDAVRFGDLVEERPRLGVPEVDVGRILSRQALVGAPNVARCRRGRDAQHSVIVAAHRSLHRPMSLLVTEIFE